MDEEWVTPEELSKRLRVSKSRIYRLARDKKLDSKKESNRLFIRASSAASLMTPNRTGFLAATSRLIDRVHDHPWFTAFAGLSSILGLIIALYAIYSSEQVSMPGSSVSSTTSLPQASPEISEKADESSVVSDVYKSPLGKYSHGEYRVRYIVFHGSSFIGNPSPIFGFLKGALKGTTYKLFNKEPYVLKTEPLKALERLATRFPEFYGDEQGVLSSTSKFNAQRIKQKFATDPSYFLLNLKTAEYSEPEFQWANAFGFIGASNIDELAGRYPKIPTFTKAIITENPNVADVTMEELYFNECDAEWGLEFENRPFKLLALDIENLNTRPIYLNYVEGTTHQVGDMLLTPWTDDGSKTGAPTRIDFPIMVLAPGEHLLVPMKLILGSFGDIDFGLHPESVPSMIPTTTLPGVNLKEGETISVYSPERTRTTTFHNEYVLGSWFEPTSVDTIGTLRRFSRSNLIYHGPLEMGSCPYAFVFEPQSNEWKIIGTLIPNRLGKKREGKSKLPLEFPANRRVLIKELENETSFLDQLYLEILTTDGRSVRLYPENELLRDRDFKYLTLRRGDAVLVTFPPISFKVQKSDLISEGYFVLGETP